MSQSTTNPAQKVGQNIAKNAKRQASSPFIQRLEQIGLIVRGVIYFTIGYLAFELALGNGGTTASPNSAISFLARQPFGKPMLLVIAIGLVGYSLWGFVRAFFDPLHRGHETKGVIARVGFFVSGISYALLVVPTMQLFLNNSTGASQAQGMSIPASLLTSPWSKWIIILFGLIWIAVGIGQSIIAYKARFMGDLKKSSMSADEYRAAVWIGKFGHAARGVVFLMVGIIVFQTIFMGGAQEPLSFDGALAKLAHAQNGEVYLAAVAIGLIIFGVYSALCAKWIKIDPRKSS